MYQNVIPGARACIRETDADRMRTRFSEDGRLHVEMPLHLSPTRRPSTASATADRHCLVPICRDAVTGQRHIRLDFRLGSEFSADDVAVDVTGAT